jgi:hypothetical protein
MNKNLRDLLKKSNILLNLSKLKYGREYLCGDYFQVLRSSYVTTIIRIEPRRYIFKHYKRNLSNNDLMEY